MTPFLGVLNSFLKRPSSAVLECICAKYYPEAEKGQHGLLSCKNAD